MKKILKTQNLIMLMTIILFAVISTAGIVSAWLTQISNGDIGVSTGYLDPSFTVTLGTGDSAVSINTPKDENGNPKYFQNSLIVLDGSDESAENYIGKFNVAVNIKTNIESYVRVKVQDEWFEERYFHSSGTYSYISLLHEAVQGDKTIPLNPFNLSEDWVYSDGYIYYQNKVTTDINIPVISGGSDYNLSNSSFFRSKCIIYVNLIFDIVQANRYQEIWGIAAIPTGN